MILVLEIASPCAFAFALLAVQFVGRTMLSKISKTFSFRHYRIMLLTTFLFYFLVFCFLF